MSRSSKTASLRKMQVGTINEEPTAVHNDLLSIGLRAVREGLTAEEFESKYGDQLKEPGDKANKNKTIGRMGRPVGNKFAENTMDASRPSSTDCRLSSIVLKVTTLSEVNAEAPSYVVGMKGARIGRGAENDISVTADVKMYPVGHAFIEYADGSFYFRDGGFDFSASVRLVPNKKQWVLEKDACFSAGSSVFRSCGSNAEGHLLVEITGGPLRGERRFVTRKGVSIGRSGDNNIALPDKELSRKHSKIVFDDVTSKYFVCDVGSTNGTYMQLVGPYANRYKLSLNDNILVGRTGFAVNRFDYGLSEEMGQRQSMEDSTAIFQQLKIPGLTNVLLTPASYFAVYDGHGGPQASAYLSQNLHVNVVEALVEAAKGIQSAAGTPAQDGLVTAALSKAFLKTDQKFLDTSENPEHGSTATTVLILGERIYCANVGDSRTILCRNFTEVLMSHDHKPTREDEARRIKDAGGYIIANRVMGELAVSRAFGDLNFKKTVKEIMRGENDNSQTNLSGLSSEEKGASCDDAPLLIAQPEFEIQTMTANDQFLLLACDGLFDVFLEEDDLINFIKNYMLKHGDTQKCCQALTHEAIKKRGSKDNVSIILIILNRWY